VALKDLVFTKEMLEQGATCGLKFDKYEVEPWTGTLEQFLQRDYTSVGVPWWNNAWLVMQMMYPQYRYKIAYKCLQELSDELQVGDTIMFRTVHNLIKVCEGTVPTSEVVGMATDFELERTRYPNQKLPKYLVAAQCATHYDTSKGCPLVVKHSLSFVDKEVIKNIVISVLNEHP
jgi:hypothetical protein